MVLLGEFVRHTLKIEICDVFLIFTFVWFGQKTLAVFRAVSDVLVVGGKVLFIQIVRYYISVSLISLWDIRVL